MPNRELPANVTSFKDRHGKVRYRFRRTGQPTYYFKRDPGTAKRPSDEYEELVAGKMPSTPRAVPGTR